MAVKSILAINGGSSTIRFATYSDEERLISGKIERAGKPLEQLIQWLDTHADGGSIAAVGHRIVHGMKRTDPALIDDAFVQELEGNVPYDPEHLPYEIEIIRACRDRYPGVPHIACFDTAFHSTMPRVAKLLPIPRRYEAAGLIRYGFHGLSYSYLVEELATEGRVILAHLGNGASLCAVRDGKSIDTTMGFTPAAGIPMSTRTGDLDPGVAWYLMSQPGFTPDRFNHLVNHESGLLGISETSSDVRDLLSKEGSDVRAAEAIEVFCYQVRKSIGSLAAALGGLDTLVFSGGIGENSSMIRGRICEGLAFLGIGLEAEANAANNDVISIPKSRVAVRVIRTNEELMIARLVRRFLSTERS